NLFENPLTVQFDHRMVAYALAFGVLTHTVAFAGIVGRRGPGPFGALMLLLAVLVQAALGIMVLLAQAPLVLSLIHQATAIVVLTAAAVHAERVARRQISVM